MKKICKIKIEPLTAVHIGTGDSITPLDYKLVKSEDSSIVYAKYSSDAILSDLIENNKTEAINEFYTLSSANNMLSMQESFHTYCKISSMEYYCEVTKKFNELYSKNINKDPTQNALEVQLMYRRNDFDKPNPIIPGSSIKGAIRTAILNKELSDFTDQKFDVLDKQIYESRDKTKEERNIQKKILSYRNEKDDPFRSIQIRDFEFNGAGCVGSFEIVSCNKHSGELNAIPTQIMAECLKGRLIKGTSESIGEFTIDEDLQKSVITNDDPKKTFIMGKKISMDSIIDSCNFFFKSEFDSEYNAFYKDSINKTLYISSLKEEIEKITSSSNQFLIRVGRWSQVEFVTLEERLRYPKTPKGRDHRQKPYGTTRTLLDYNGDYVPMGWCKCTLMK